jgi:hypothetical protein
VKKEFDLNVYSTPDERILPELVHCETGLTHLEDYNPWAENIFFLTISI